MNNSLTIFEKMSQLPELVELGESKAEALLQRLTPMATKLREEFQQPYEQLLAEISAEGITPQIEARAKRLRLDAVKIRTETDKIRKDEKDFYLNAGRAIDSMAKLVMLDAQALESALKVIEDHSANLEKARLDSLQLDRETELRKWSQDASTAGLCNMANDVWEAYIGKKKSDFEAWQKHLEQERIEQERREKIESMHNERRNQALPFYDFWDEFERQLNFGEQSQGDFDAFMNRIQNAKAEHDENMRQIEAERDRLRLESQEKEKELEAEREKARIEAKAKQDEIDQLQRIEDERKAKEDADRKAQELAAKKAASAPDKNKLLALAYQLKTFPMPEMATADGLAILDSLKSSLAEKIQWIETRANEL